MNETNTLFNADFIQDVCQALKENGPVNREFSTWGKLHIDRRLPFLCIYVRPAKQADKGTRKLILGQASYILVQEEDTKSNGFTLFLEQIATELASDFGAFLMLEVASIATSEKLADESFVIKTSKHDAPQSVLESLENALLDIVVEEVSFAVNLEYHDQNTAPGVAKLLTSPQLNNAKQYWINLNVSAFYRHNGKVLPYALKQLHAGITHALRRTFYAFIHQYTNKRPQHFHELGRRSISQDVKTADMHLSAIKDQFSILFHVTPVNVDEAWREFKSGGFQKSPNFNYRPRPVDPNLLKRQLYAIPIEKIEDPTLADVFESQRNELSHTLSMIDERNKKNFLYASLQVYGGVDTWLAQLAKQILKDIPPDRVPTGKNEMPFVSAQAFAKRAEILLGNYRQQYPEFIGNVQIRKDIPGILVSSGNLMIGHNSRFAEDRVDATLAHEVGTHMLTYVNGKAQPFQQFHSGMADYESLQEGLAVLSEFLVDKLQPSRLRTLAARVLAVEALILGADFVQVFNLLHRNLGFSANAAFQISMRVFRGGGFTKDMVYLKGLSELLTYLAKGENIDILYVGKIALRHIGFVDELLARKIIKKGLATPHYLETETGKRLLQQARQCHSVVDLIRVK